MLEFRKGNTILGGQGEASFDIFLIAQETGTVKIILLSGLTSS